MTAWPTLGPELFPQAAPGVMGASIHWVHLETQSVGAKAGFQLSPGFAVKCCGCHPLLQGG